MSLKEKFNYPNLIASIFGLCMAAAAIQCGRNFTAETDIPKGDPVFSPAPRPVKALVPAPIKDVVIQFEHDSISISDANLRIIAAFGRQVANSPGACQSVEVKGTANILGDQPDDPTGGGARRNRALSGARAEIVATNLRQMNLGVPVNAFGAGTEEATPEEVATEEKLAADRGARIRCVPNVEGGPN